MIQIVLVFSEAIAILKKRTKNCSCNFLANYVMYHYNHKAALAVTHDLVVPDVSS